jgi:hypothetical protein
MSTSENESSKVKKNIPFVPAWLNQKNTDITALQREKIALLIIKEETYKRPPKVDPDKLSRWVKLVKTAVEFEVDVQELFSVDPDLIVVGEQPKSWSDIPVETKQLIGRYLKFSGGCANLYNPVYDIVRNNDSIRSQISSLKSKAINKTSETTGEPNLKKRSKCDSNLKGLELGTIDGSEFKTDKSTLKICHKSGGNPRTSEQSKTKKQKQVDLEARLATALMELEQAKEQLINMNNS